MPRRKADNPRSIILAIRLTPSERHEISRRAANMPLGQWIRERALACPEMPHSPPPQLFSQNGCRSQRWRAESLLHSSAKLTRITGEGLTSGASQP
jgi:hypothetical protein